MAGNKNSGRKPMEPTQDQRDRVKVMIATGSSLVQVAEHLRISIPTLNKHFFEEIERGSADVRAEVVMANYRKAVAGDAAAIKKMMEMTGLVPEPGRRVPAPKKLGKKAQADQDAQTGHEGSEWADLVKPTSRRN